VVLLDVDQLLFASVLLVEDLAVWVVHEVIALACQKQSWYFYVLHFIYQLQIGEVYVAF
jgi:hypothetical protein